MSKKKVVTVDFDSLKISPFEIYEGKVIKHGNGAVISSFKKYVGRKVTVIIHDPEIDKGLSDDLGSSAGRTGWH